MVNILAGIAIAALMLQAGLESSLTAIINTVHQRTLMIRAIAINIVAVPILAWLVCRIFSLPDGITTGILLMAVAPGVPFLPFAAGRTKGGHLAFAVGLVFVFAAISVVTAPLTANLILPATERVELPIVKFFTTLVLFQLIPLLAGLALSNANSTLSKMLLRVLAIFVPLSILALLIVIAVPAAQAIGAIAGSRGLLAMILVVCGSLLMGWMIAGTDRGNRVTLSIGTALRNPGIGALIATSTFAGTIVVPSVVSYIVVQLLIAAAPRLKFKRDISSLARSDEGVIPKSAL